MSTEVLQIDIDAARNRAERIRFHATNANEAMESLQKLIHMARELEDHVTLGYASWTAYVSDLFGSEPLRLARDVRRELVAELSEAGMSTRAIAPVVGVTPMQVSRDVRESAGVTNVTPEPSLRSDEVAALVGGGFVESIDDLTVDTSTGEVIEEEPAVTEHTVTEKTTFSTGLDGKKYKRPEPKPQIDGETQAAIDTCISAAKAATTLHQFVHEKKRELVAREWWPRWSKEVAPIHRQNFSPAELRNIAEGLSQLANEMEYQNAY